MDGPLLSLPASFDAVGQPVSAMYIVGWFESCAAGCTLVSWKNSFTQPADWSIDTFANHAWMFDMP